MHQSPDILASFGDWETRMERALASVRAGRGVLVVDDEDRENEGPHSHKQDESGKATFHHYPKQISYFLN